MWESGGRREQGARGPRENPLGGIVLNFIFVFFWESEKYEPAAGAWRRGEDLVGVTI